MDSCQWANAFYTGYPEPFVNGNFDTFYSNWILLGSDFNWLAQITIDTAELQPGKLGKSEAI